MRRLWLAAPVSLALLGCCSCGRDRRPVPDDGSLRFSHALHQRAGVTCAECHTQVATSAHASDNLLPREAACMACHTRPDHPAGPACTICHVDPTRARALENPSRGVLFDHQRHLALNNLPQTLTEAMDGGLYPVDMARVRAQVHPGVACSACHRGLETVDFAGPAQLPSMSDCLVCHSPPGNAMEQCAHCHPAGTDLRPPDHHVETFFDGHSALVDSTGAARCRECHTPGFNPCMQCH